MKKIVLGCTLIICATICLCTLVLCGFIVCTGEGCRTWSFTQYGFAHVITELSWVAVAVPIILFIAGIGFIVSAFSETNNLD